MGEAWLITSGKGGVGKSVTAVNLGAALWRLNRSVVLIDADTGLRSLDVLLGMENRVVYDLCDVAEGVCRLKQALLPDREMHGLFLVAAAQTRDSGAVTPYQLERVSARLKEMFDFVLIDCPAGVGRGFRAAAAASGKAAIVVTPDAVAVRDAERVAGLLEQHEINKPSLIVNRVTREHLKKNAPLSPERIAGTLGLALLGVIPEDKGVARAASEGRPIVPRRSPASAAYQATARRMLGEELPFTVYGGLRWFNK